MKKLLLLICLFSFHAKAQKSYGSFVVTIRDKKISVISPKKKLKQQNGVVTIIVKNETFDKIYSEIKTKTNTLKRFVLEPASGGGSTFTFTVDHSKFESLFYVSISPPFQEAPLIFGKENYEIP